MNADAGEPLPPFHFLRALAAQVRAEWDNPNRAAARQLVKLIDLHQHLAAAADGPDGALAEGLAAALMPAIRAAAGRLGLSGP